MPNPYFLTIHAMIIAAVMEAICMVAGEFFSICCAEFHAAVRLAASWRS
jgi:hypothetical protein